MTTLILTNGDVVADALREAGVDAEIVPWRDVLHEGPLPPTESDEAFRLVRAEFLDKAFPPGGDDADAGSATLDELEERDAVIDGHDDFQRIELWFEHDLYDQLQLAQLLAMLHARGRRSGVYHLVVDRHLGPLGPEKLVALSDQLLTTGPETLAAGAAIWNAVRQPSPEAIAAAHTAPAPALPFIRAAMTRLLEELPGPGDGLSRTERQILYSIDRGITRTGMLFARVLNMEEASFLGDYSFFNILSGLATVPEPLVAGLSEPFRPEVLRDGTRRKAFIQATLGLTDAGRSVLAGKADHVALNGIDRWVGGTHLTPANVWRFDRQTNALLPPASKSA